MLTAIGAALIVFGLISIVIGDKELPLRGGAVLRLFSWPRGRMKWAKWVIGGALI